MPDQRADQELRRFGSRMPALPDGAKKPAWQQKVAIGSPLSWPAASAGDELGLWRLRLPAPAVLGDSRLAVDLFAAPGTEPYALRRRQLRRQRRSRYPLPAPSFALLFRRQCYFPVRLPCMPAELAAVIVCRTQAAAYLRQLLSAQLRGI